MTRQAIVTLLMCGSFIANSQQTAANTLATESDKYLQSGQYDLAIAGYRRLLQLDPNSAGAWSNMGSAFFAKADFAGASRSFARASRLRPRNPDFAFNTALSYVRQDRCAEAANYLRTAMQSAKYRKGGHYLGGLCAFISEQWSRSEEELRNAVTEGNDSAETYYMLAIVTRKLRHTGEARHFYELLKTSYPNSSFYHELTGQALDRANEDTDAEKQIEMAIAADPHAPGLHAQLGLLLFKINRITEAKEAFLSELAIDDRSYSALHYLGEIAEKSNSLVEALTWYRRALLAQPDSGDARFAIGRALEMTGEDRSALKELRIAETKMPEDVSVHYWMARTLKHLGSTESAKLELRRVKYLLAAQRSAQLQSLGNGVQ